MPDLFFYPFLIQCTYSLFETVLICMNKTKMKLRVITHIASYFFNGAKSPPVQNGTFGQTAGSSSVVLAKEKAGEASSYLFMGLYLWSSLPRWQAGMGRIKKSALMLFIFLIQFRISIAQTVTEQGNIPSEFAQHGLETLNKMTSAVNVFLALLFIASIIGFMVSGIKFIIAGGDEGMLEGARKTGIASVVGFLLSLIGYVIINIIKHFIV